MAYGNSSSSSSSSSSPACELRVLADPASFFGCFEPCWFFQMPLPSFCFVGALYVSWVFLTWIYFLLEPFFFLADPDGLENGGGSTVMVLLMMTWYIFNLIPRAPCGFRLPPQRGLGF
jgi:hypothetical protein